jgi:hypothetical protein
MASAVVLMSCHYRRAVRKLSRTSSRATANEIAIGEVPSAFAAFTFAAWAATPAATARPSAGSGCL